MPTIIFKICNIFQNNKCHRLSWLSNPTNCSICVLPTKEIQNYNALCFGLSTSVSSWFQWGEYFVVQSNFLEGSRSASFLPYNFILPDRFLTLIYILCFQKLHLFYSFSFLFFFCQKFELNFGSQERFQRISKETSE